MSRHLSSTLAGALALGIATATTLGAQAPVLGPARIGLIAGINSATLGGSDVEDADRLTGFVAGAYLVKPLAAGLSLRPELLLSQQGAETRIEEEEASGTAKLKLTYLQIPVLLQYEAPRAVVKPHLYAGPSVGIRTGCSVEGSGDGVTVSVDCDEFDLDVKSLDVSAVLGAGVSFPAGRQAVTVGARFVYGLTDIAEDAAVRNRVISVYGSIELPFGRR